MDSPFYLTVLDHQKPMNLEPLLKLIFDDTNPRQRSLFESYARDREKGFNFLSLKINIGDSSQHIEFKITQHSWDWIRLYKFEQVVAKIDGIATLDDPVERKWLMHAFYYLKYLERDFETLTSLFTDKISLASNINILEIGSGFGANATFLHQLLTGLGVEKFQIYATEINYLVDMQNHQGIRKNPIHMYSLLSGFLTENSPQVIALPFNPQEQPPFTFPETVTLDFVFSIRSFNYLFTDEFYDSVINSHLKNDSYLMFDFCNAMSHKDANQIHIFNESSIKHINYLQHSSPPNAYRLLMPKNVYTTYAGKQSRERKGIFFTP